MPRVLFPCQSCGKQFDQSRKRDQHRSNTPTCRDAYNWYLESLAPSDPSVGPDITDTPMEGAMESTLEGHTIEPVTAVPVQDNNPDVEMVNDAPERQPYQTQSSQPELPDALQPSLHEASDEASESSRSFRASTDDGSTDGGVSDDAGANLPNAANEAQWQGFQSDMAEPVQEAKSECVDIYDDAGRVVANGIESYFDKILSSRRAAKIENMYHPFANEEEWELVAWLHRTGASSREIDDFLKLKYVQSRPLSFRNAKKMRNLIEQLPDAGPRWMEHTVLPHDGTPEQPAQMLYRDPLQLIEYILARPAFADHMEYAPRRVWKDQTRTSRRYSEMWTGDWWWRTQARLPSIDFEPLPTGSTVIPVMLGSDKTLLTVHAGDKNAWPVYLSLGNISSKIRNTPSQKAWFVVAYLPDINFVEGANDTQRNSTLVARLFHQCMEVLLKPLIEAGNKGIMCSDSKGDMRHCFPYLAAYLADHPEQTLINIALQNGSSTTIARKENLDDPVPSPPRTRHWILAQIDKACAETHPARLDAYYKTARARGLSTVHKPFWRHHAKYQPEVCMAPDLLHGPGKFWRDHLLKWIRRLIGFDEFDTRLKALQPIRGYRHFKQGISHISQWTGREDRELQRILVAVVSGAPNVTPEVMRNIRAYHDFLYLAQYTSHSDSTLRYLTDALAVFHATKHAYIDLEVRFGGKNERRTRKQAVLPHFHIPKLAAFHSYAIHIREMGSSPQYSTEITEYNHQFMAKQAYKATNRKEYGGQMVRFVDRVDRLLQVSEFIAWNTKRTNQMILNNATQPGVHSPGYNILLKKRLNSVWASNNAPKATQNQKERLWLTLVPHLTQEQVEDVSDVYCLPMLDSAIYRFLSSHRNQRDITAGVNQAEVQWIDVWYNIQIRVPDIQDEGSSSQRHTVEALKPGKGHPYGHCHFVLLHDSKDAGFVGVQGYRVAQIRLLFRPYLDNVTHPLHLKPLAYIQELSRLASSPEDDIAMYRVSRVERNGEERRGRVISIDSIARFVQLIPCFGPQADPELNAYNSAEICRDYYLNSFADKQIYQSVY